MTVSLVILLTVGAGSKPAQMTALYIRVGLEPTPTVTYCYMM